MEADKLWILPQVLIVSMITIGLMMSGVEQEKKIPYLTADTLNGVNTIAE